MNRIRVVATGQTGSQQANARGKLFERIVAKVLTHYGYEITEHNLNINLAGMELDIHGQTTITGLPFYAECKCYSSDVRAEKLQTFFGKYMTQWLAEKRCQELFVALPGVNSHALGFYKQHCESNDEVTVRLLQEDAVLTAIVDSGLALSPQEVSRKVDCSIGRPGESELLCTPHGFFWKQFIVPLGSGLPTQIQLYDAYGTLVTDDATLSSLADLAPDLAEFEIPKKQPPIARHGRDFSDDIVELRGSSACFEYQFPAAPEFFVGRHDLLTDVHRFFDDVLKKKTSARGLLFEANSGWGKNSAVLATIDQLTSQGHFALAIDCRSASSSQFVLRAIERALTKYGDFNGLVDQDPQISGFASAISSLLDVGRSLRDHNCLLCIFFDQFENLFHLPEILAHIAQLCLKVGDAETNIVLGFSWKTDLVGLTREFPYHSRDTIIENCHLSRVMPFSDHETDALLDRLAVELRSKLRRDLRFLLSEFAQGYPWLLKKLCAHVKTQRESGVMQADIARNLLNVEELFREDLDGLTAEEEAALRSIAVVAPVSVEDLGDDFPPALIQSLVDRRLIVRVGTRYDIYWDIFRDYLNRGYLPVQELYILRAQVGTILNAMSLLRRAGGSLDVDSFRSKVNMSAGAYLNMLRDLRVLKLAVVDADSVKLTLPTTQSDEESTQVVRDHFRHRLRTNRVVYDLLHDLETYGELPLAQVAEVMRRSFPFISAIENTWTIYARILCGWLDLAELAVFDSHGPVLTQFREGSEIRERHLVFSRKNRGIKLPTVHFAAVTQMAEILTTAVRNKEPVDWSALKRSTIYKSLADLEELGLVRRTAKTIMVAPECEDFANEPTKRLEIAREAVAGWPLFNRFLAILEDNQTARLTQRDLGEALSKESDLGWKPSTAETNAKICLDWARHLRLAPTQFAYSHRGQFRKTYPKTLDIFRDDQEDGT